MYHVFVDLKVGGREIEEFQKFGEAEDFGNWILGGLNVQSVRIYRDGRGRILAQGYERDEVLR